MADSNYPSNPTHQLNKQQAHAEVADQINTVTAYYDRDTYAPATGAALLMPGNYARETVRTMRRSWPGYRPSVIHCVEGDADTYAGIEKQMREAVVAEYGDSEYGRTLPIRCHKTEVRDFFVRENARGYEFAYVDLDMCGRMTGTGSSFNSKSQVSVVELIPWLVTEHMKPEGVLQITSTCRGVCAGTRRNTYFQREMATNVASENETGVFAFRKVYLSGSDVMWRGSMALWPGGDTARFVRPVSYYVDSHGRTLVPDQDHAFDLPPAPLPSELTAFARGHTNKPRYVTAA